MHHLYKFLLLIILINSSFSFAQDAPQSPILGEELLSPGSGRQAPAGPPVNPDAQLYLPETFSPTEALPTAREREELSEQTNAIPVPYSQYRAGFTFAGKYGQFDKLPYTDIYLSPYMQLGPFFFMYEIPLRFDWNSAFITQMWTSIPALVSKIELDLYYSKTNHVFKFFRATVSRAPTLVQGHGRFLYDFNPNLYGPYEPFKTFQLGLDVSYIGLDFIIANIANPNIMSAEFFIKPLAQIKNPKVQAYKDLKIYITYGIDLDPFQSFSPSLYQFAPNPDSPILSMIETGIDIPVYASPKKVFALELYADYSQILSESKNNLTIRPGYGIGGGFIMTFIESIPLRFEIAHAFDYWQPRWINVFYYVDSPYVNQDNIIIENNVMTLKPNLTYFTASMGYKMPEKAIFFNIEMYGDFASNELWLTLSFTLGNVLLKQLSFSVYWTIRSLYSGFEMTPQNSILELNLKYHMLPNMNWGLLVKINGRIADTIVDDNPTIEPAPFIFIGLDYSFRF